jgi:hypothetical protein
VFGRYEVGGTHAIAEEAGEATHGPPHLPRWSREKSLFSFKCFPQDIVKPSRASNKLRSVERLYSCCTENVLAQRSLPCFAVGKKSRTNLNVPGRYKYLSELEGLVFENYRTSKITKGYYLMCENSRDIWNGGS